VEEDSITQTPPRGALVDMFLKCGVKCDRIYYSFQSLLEYNSFEVYSGFTDYLKKSEMPYLIKRWYQTDKSLKDGISDDKIRNLEEYALETDPVAQFLRETS
jgi:nuclear pore complex protein Nup155